MKKKSHHKLLLIFLFLSVTAIDKLQAQDTAASPTILGLTYYLPENKVPYIVVNTKKKVGRKFLPVKNIPVNVYFGEAADENLLGKLITNDNGLGRVAFPASFKTAWDSLDQFTILAASAPTAKELLNTDMVIKKAILVIDTASEDGIRTVTAQLKEKRGAAWIAVGEIEMKLRIKRLLGNLTVGK